MKFTSTGAVTGMWSVKMMLLKTLQIHRKTPVWESLFNNVVGLQACNCIKRRLQQRFSCETCEILKNTRSCYYIYSNYVIQKRIHDPDKAFSPYLFSQTNSTIEV